MRTNPDNIKGNRILIVGLGRSGIAAVHAMLDLGAVVSVQDDRERASFDPNFITYLENKEVTCWFHCLPEDMGAYDMVILSPGVNPELPFIQEAKARGAEITGELEIAFRISRGEFIAITGTNGKTTTTTLVGEIFKESGRTTHVVGNIGTAVIGASETADEDDWLVTECSSFQLETTRYFNPHVSAILNLTPDHLNRHHTMEAYGAAKAKIFANQTGEDFLVINYDDKLCYGLAEGAKCNVIPFSRKEELERGAFLKDGRIVIREKGVIYDICDPKDLKIIGDHNVENVLAASAIAFYAGIAPEVITRAVLDFGGVEHRIEYCGTVDGIKYYHDSKGTNIDAAVTALRAIRENIILIAGGDAKGQVFDEFIEAFQGSVKKMLVLGRDGHFITEAADRCGFSDYIVCKDLPDCVKRAAAIAEPGDTVLLSPACASWDMYDNYEQRGEHFKECVRLLEE